MTIFQGTDVLPGASPGITKPFGVVGGAAQTVEGNATATIPIANAIAERRGQDCFIKDITALKESATAAARWVPLPPSPLAAEPGARESFRCLPAGIPAGRIQ
jgi:hypothetical protein